MHGIEIPDPVKLWDLLQGIVVEKTITVRNEKKRVIVRKDTIAKRSEVVGNYIHQVKLFLEVKQQEKDSDKH